MLYSFEQVAQLVKKLSEAGWEKGDLTLFGQASVEKLSNILAYLRGQMDIVAIKHTINLATPPCLPFDNAEVVKHEGEGVVEIELRSDDHFYVDGKKVVLHLSERQMGDKEVVGHELRQELEGGELVLLNSNVLDYIFDHPELYPEHWKKNEQGETLFIFFWGSIFRSPSDGSLYVRYLYCFGGELDRHCSWLDDDWDRRRPSASVARS